MIRFSIVGLLLILSHHCCGWSDEDGSIKSPSEVGMENNLSIREIAALGAAPSQATTTPIDPTKFTKMPANLEKPLPLGVILNLVKIYKINESTKSFDALVDIKLLWNDTLLIFDPKNYGTDERTFSMGDAERTLGEIWNPHIIISNLIDKPMSQQSTLSISSGGDVVYTQRIKGSFQTKYDLISFPFDSQSLAIELLSTVYNDSQVQFTQTQYQIDHSGINVEAITTGWKVGPVNYIRTNQRGLEGYYYSKFIAQFTIDRISIGHLFAVAPLLLIILVPTILTLYTNIEILPRLVAWSGAILALIAMSFTLDIRYPNLESNSLISKTIGIISIYEFFMITITMTLLNPNISNKIENPFIVKEAIKILRWSIPMVLITIITFVVLITSLLDIL